MEDILSDEAVSQDRGAVDRLDARSVDLSTLSPQAKALVEELAASHPAIQIRINQADPLQATYIDRSEASVDTGALKTIQEAGYVITEAGTDRPHLFEQSAHDEDRPRERAAVTFRPQGVGFDG